MATESKKTPERPFGGLKIYYSGSMAGVAELDLDFPSQLVTYMEQGGAEVLDKHVAIPHKGDEFLAAIALTHGFTFEEWQGLAQHEKDTRIYRHDMKLIDQATHVITLLNGASHGVGMEVQEALRKPHMGLNHTPILGLVHESAGANLSPMMRGASHVYAELFQLQTYTNLESAQQAIHTFLTAKPS
ncbi:MAG TPA: hypothetical protein VLF68_02210 [Candidatus Saccharimonadales bacterium]|nr:hypothetical protein [Candidatus Saccharimonadales bacterium]